MRFAPLIRLHGDGVEGVGHVVRRSHPRRTAAVRGAQTADQVQEAAFGAIRGNNVTPGEFFPVVYGVLLGAPKGPRLGPYVMDAGPSVVAEKLEKAVSKVAG